MIIRQLMLGVLAIAVVASGCAKKPATSVSTAPAPTGQGASMQRPTEPVRNAAVETRPTGPRTQSNAAGQRPVPSEFMDVADLKDVHFEFDKYDIRTQDAAVLDTNAGWLKQNAGHLVLIEGHCDERGTNEYNVALGDRRAKATKNYLVAHGIADNRITIVSYGEERPACTAKSEDCFMKNRRAHFRVKAQ